MEYRGPQFVQLVNAYPKRRPVGSRISARHSGQVARSTEIRVKPPLRDVLGPIVNASYPKGWGSVATARCSMRELAGASCRSEAKNSCALDRSVVSISTTT